MAIFCQDRFELVCDKCKITEVVEVQRCIGDDFPKNENMVVLGEWEKVTPMQEGFSPAGRFEVRILADHKLLCPKCVEQYRALVSPIFQFWATDVV